MARARASTWACALIALLLTVPATVAIARADGTLPSGPVPVFRNSVVVSGVPISVVAPDDEEDRPAVVVVHGYAGSSTIMDPLAVALARAGYRVVLPGLRGHGTNTTPLTAGGDALESDIAVALDWISSQHGVITDQIGLVGHSMGAGAVVRYAIADARGSQRVRATVALSLPSADEVPAGEPAVPRNLLLMWGSAEQPRFAEAGERGVRAAYPDAEIGRSYGDSTNGTSRGTVVVPGVEHIGIVFSPVTAQQTVDWLDTTVAVASPGHTVESDGRLLWLVVLLIGAVVGFIPLARAAFGARRDDEPSASAPVVPAAAVVPVMVVAAIAASLVTTALTAGRALLPLALADFGAAWFAVAGILAGVAATWLVRGRRSTEVSARGGVGRQVVATLALTAYLVAVLALASQHTWSDFALVGPRAWVLPIVEVAFLAFFWADERLVSRASRPRRALLVVANRVVVVAALLGAVALLGAPGVLTLWIPLLVPLLALVGVCAFIVSGLTRERWAPAVVQAIPLAYVVATSFPIVG